MKQHTFIFAAALTGIAFILSLSSFYPTSKQDANRYNDDNQSYN